MLPLHGFHIKPAIKPILLNNDVVVAVALGALCWCCDQFFDDRKKKYYDQALFTLTVIGFASIRSCLKMP